MLDPTPAPGRVPGPVTRFRVRDAARLVGVSDDTVRRWIDAGQVPAHKDDAGRLVVEGVDLLDAWSRADGATDPAAGTSARNRFVGLVTHVVSDRVMSEVQLRCGPFTVTSLMSTDSVRRLGLAPGALAAAVVKATTVIVETPEVVS